MKLLIVTQKADRKDPVLGFFHRWLELFAGRVDALTVIAQSAEDYSLPANAQVYSLGKEHGRSTAAQIVTFWRIIWRERGRYDAVLVHMTPVWVILGWPVWFLLRKRVYLWYEIRRGSWRLSLALLLVRKVFCATVQGLPRPHRKQVVTGHGIDTELFCLPPTPDPSPSGGVGHGEHGLVIAVGRITRSKRYDQILRAFASLPSSTRLRIAGGMITREDEGEWEALQRQMQELGITGRVEADWADSKTMLHLYQSAQLMLHACVGGLDKAVLEAMACGCPVVSSGAAAQEVLPEVCRATPDTMTAIAQGILRMSDAERSALSQELRRRVLERHNLSKLIERLVREMEC